MPYLSLVLLLCCELWQASSSVENFGSKTSGHIICQACPDASQAAWRRDSSWNKTHSQQAEVAVLICLHATKHPLKKQPTTLPSACSKACNQPTCKEKSCSCCPLRNSPFYPRTLTALNKGAIPLYLYRSCLPRGWTGVPQAQRHYFLWLWLVKSLSCDSPCFHAQNTQVMISPLWINAVGLPAGAWLFILVLFSACHKVLCLCCFPIFVSATNTLQFLHRKPSSCKIWPWL